MAFKIRRGTNAERLTITPAQGELIYTTDTKKLYVGDGTTVGGNAVNGNFSFSVDNKITSSNLAAEIEVLNPKGISISATGNDGYAQLQWSANNTLNDQVGPVSWIYVTKDGCFMENGKAAPNGYRQLLHFNINGDLVLPNNADIKRANGTSMLYTLPTATNTVLGGVKVDNNTISINNGVISANLTSYASTTYVDNKVDQLVGGASSAFDTLKELQTLLNDDANFGANLTNTLAAKANTASLSNVAFSGNYGDLSNKPSIPAAPVNADWNATTGLEQILNKPSIPNLASVAQDILPTTDITYNLGSPSKRFKDLYLSTNTLFLGNTAISVDPVKGIQTKTEGGGEGYGSDYVEWLGSPVLVFGGVTVTDPLYIMLQKLKKGDQIKEKAQPYQGATIGPADFLLNVTGPAVFGTISNGKVDVNVPVDQDKGANTTGQGGGTQYYVGYVEFRYNPITDVSQLVDNQGLLDRTMITTGSAPGSSAVASANSVDINFSDGVGNKFKFNRDGKITFAAPQYGTSVTSMYVDYGFRFRPTWNGTGTGPELAVSWNDGIELTPITNDHFTGSNKATPFFIQGTYTDQAGKLPGDVWIDGGRNGPANTNGIVNIGRGYTNSINIGKTGTATTIIFNDGSSINSGDITGDQNVDGGGGAVPVWSSPVNTAGMTAKVVVSGKDLATGETQSCEVLLAKKQGSQSISATVYGIVHTSTDPLFTVSATVETNGQIRVNASVPGSITSVNVKSVGRVTVL